MVCYPTFGGSGVLATELGKALAEKGHQVHFMTYKQPVRLNMFHANIRFHEVQVPTYPLFEYPPYELALASTMVDVIANEHLDLLHVHYAIPHASAAYMARQIVFRNTGVHIPVITTLHGTDITLVGKDKTYGPVVAFSINESDAITAVSENLKKETIKNFDIEKTIEVIPNFVDIKRFCASKYHVFKKMLSPKNEKIILHVSNFRKVKRVTDVIEVFAKIAQHLPSLLFMVGDGPERPALEELVREKNLSDKVRFLGKLEQVEEIMAVSDLFILPSNYESFGLSALEAMAAHTVVVASNVGGLPEIITNEKDGFLATVGDVDTMSRYAIEILSDEDHLTQMKENAYNTANRFDIGNVVPLYENLYRRYL